MSSTHAIPSPQPSRPATPAPAAIDDAVRAIDLSLSCDDGRSLAATWYEPARADARAVAVMNSATGVPRHFYRAFAQWMAARGYAVLTYDYRGIG